MNLFNINYLFLGINIETNKYLEHFRWRVIEDDNENANTTSHKEPEAVSCSKNEKNNTSFVP